jgi:hypothetical protein
MALKRKDRNITIIIDEPFVFDDIQRFIKSFRRIDLDTPDAGRRISRHIGDETQGLRGAPKGDNKGIPF